MVIGLHRLTARRFTQVHRRKLVRGNMRPVLPFFVPKIQPVTILNWQPDVTFLSFLIISPWVSGWVSIWDVSVGCVA